MSNENEKFLVTESSSSPLVLQMLLDEIKQARASQGEFQTEARAEFRRIHDKMDKLRDEVRSDFQEHDRDIVKLTTEASMAGRAAGFIAGAVASLAIQGAVALFSWLLERGTL